MARVIRKIRLKEKPEISIITCTYNGERIINDYLKSIFSQDYPIEKIELILADGGSRDKTLEIIKNYQKKYPRIIKLIHNEKQYAEGKGMGKDIASRKATGEFILFLDQDNILIQKNWLSKMVEILVNDSGITAVQSRIAVPKKASILDKYLNAIGIEDPFAIPYSLNAQLVFNPRNFQYKKDKEKNYGYYIYTINKKQFYYAGNNGFLIRKKDFFDNGGYTQDIDNFYRMAKKEGKRYKIAVPKNIKLYHKTSTKLSHFLKKRSFYIKHYLLKNYESREFYWFNLKKNSFKENLKFIKIVLFNLILIPAGIQGIKMALKDKKGFWLIHPFILFLITLDYIYSFAYSKIIRKEKAVEI